jgi:hypothetical protein
MSIESKKTHSYMHSMNALRVRNLPDEWAAGVERQKRRRGMSLNQTVIDLLRQSLGVKGTCSNGVGRFAGTWSEAEHEEFLSKTWSFEEIDQDLWQRADTALTR